jgi:hypothetical protein
MLESDCALFYCARRRMYELVCNMDPDLLLDLFENDDAKAYITRAKVISFKIYMLRVCYVLKLYV